MSTIDVRNPEIKSTSFKLIVLLSIQLLLIIIYNILKIIENILNLASVGSQRHTSSRSPTTGVTGTSTVVFLIVTAFMVYYVSFLRAVNECRRDRILVFAWLGVIQLILIPVLLTFTILGIGVFSSETNNMEIETVFLVNIGISGVSFILLIFIVVLSFILAKLLKKLTTSQIV